MNVKWTMKVVAEEVVVVEVVEDHQAVASLFKISTRTPPWIPASSLRSLAEKSPYPDSMFFRSLVPDGLARIIRSLYWKSWCFHQVETSGDEEKWFRWTTTCVERASEFERLTWTTKRATASLKSRRSLRRPSHSEWLNRSVYLSLSIRLSIIISIRLCISRRLSTSLDVSIRQSLSLIPLKDGTEERISVADYFASKYYRLRFPRLPCLQVTSLFQSK